MKFDRSLQLPQYLREQLGKPIDHLISGKEENLNEAVKVVKQTLRSGSVGGVIVTVGDIVAKSFNEGGLQMDIAIIDFQVKRVETFKNLSEIGFVKTKPDVTVENPKGTLTPESFTAVKKALHFVQGKPLQAQSKPFVIRVFGEEDLLTLVAILLAPLDTHVFYGQPNQGIVEVVVTEDKKSEVRDTLSKFT